MDNFDRFLGWVLQGMLVVLALIVAIALGGVAFIFGATLASIATGVIAGIVVAAMSGVYSYRLMARFLDWLER